MVLPELPQMGGGGVLLCLMVEEISAHENYVDIALHVELLFIFLLTCKVYVRTVTEVRLAGAVLHYK